MDLIAQLKEITAEDRVSVNETVLDQHSRDESYHPARRPDVVVFPQTTEEVSRILCLANEQRIPVVPFGLGSSLEGHVIPYQGGITLDFSQMNRVLKVKPDDFLAVVQPGVTRTQLNKELKKYGLFFSVDPGADATLGGMAATNASGTTTVRYGVMRDQVRDLEVVLADGRVIRTGSRAAKSSAGYDLTGLIIGSEGTLGVITQLTVRVFGIPEQILAARASFPSLDQAVQAVIAILSAGIPIARVELVDEESVRQVNGYMGTSYKEAPTLFLEFHGNEQGLRQDVDFTREIVLEAGCDDIQFETDTTERNRLWEARHKLAYAYIHSAPGKRMMATDVCVPISQLAGAISQARAAVAASGLLGGIVGHVGDGNYHVILMVDPEDPHDVQKAEAVNQCLVEDALNRGGTCTGEHGVGVGKMKYLEREFGPALDVMATMKQTLDPHNILNPGKKIPIHKHALKN